MERGHAHAYPRVRGETTARGDHDDVRRAEWVLRREGDLPVEASSGVVRSLVSGEHVMPLQEVLRVGSRDDAGERLPVQKLQLLLKALDRHRDAGSRVSPDRTASPPRRGARKCATPGCIDEPRDHDYWYQYWYWYASDLTARSKFFEPSANSLGGSARRALRAQRVPSARPSARPSFDALDTRRRA